MSLDHEDIKRIERIEKTYRQFTEDINGLSHQLIDMRKAITTIEKRLFIMDELKKEKIKDMNQQVDSMIDQLPIGVRGMMKKMINKGDEKNG